MGFIIIIFIFRLSAIYYNIYGFALCFYNKGINVFNFFSFATYPLVVLSVFALSILFYKSDLMGSYTQLI